MTIVIVPPAHKAVGKLADVEVHFTEGPLEGMKLLGFAVWEPRSGQGRNVTFPARSFTGTGERRTYALLRPVTSESARQRVRELILDAFEEYEKHATTNA